MWKYNRQIVIRWLSFIVSIAILSWLAFTLNSENPELFTKAGLKTEITRISVNADLAPIWLLPTIFASTALLMLTGLPSIVFFGLLLILKGFPIALAITYFCQLIATFISMMLANRSYRAAKLPAQLIELLKATQNNYQSFAFWSRLYYSFPLRTIDSLTPMVHPESRPLFESLMPAAPAIFIRMLIPALWLESLTVVLSNFSPDPAMDATRLLLWSSALIAYTMIPRVPELFICPEKVKKILLKIESPNSDNGATPVAVNPKKQPFSEKKLTGITGPAIKENSPPQPQLVK